MEKLDVSLGRYRMICLNLSRHYSGIYGVYVFKDGTLMMHQSWGKKPTEQDLLDIMQRYIDLDEQRGEYGS